MQGGSSGSRPKETRHWQPAMPPPQRSGSMKPCRSGAGPALADVDLVPSARAQAGRLEEERLAALEARAEALLACGRHRELIAELESLTVAHPLRERFWFQRMLALYRVGRQADALRAYRDLRTILVAELAIEPGPDLRDLEARILRQDRALDGPAVTGFAAKS